MARGSRERLTPWSRRLTVGLLAVIAGAILLGSSLTVLIPWIALLPTRPVIEILKSGEQPATPQLRQATERAEWVTQLFDLPPAHKDAGMLRLGQQSVPDLPAEAVTEELRAAITHLRAGLRRAPSDGFNWFRLALAELAVDGFTPNETALDALRMSTSLAEFEPVLMYRRLGLWMIYHGQLSDGDRQVYRRQLVMAFEHDPARLVRQASTSGMLYTIRRELLTSAIAPESLNRHFPVPLNLGGPKPKSSGQ